MAVWMPYDNLVRDLNKVMPLFNEVCNTLDLPNNVRKTALDNYRLLIIKELTKGRKRNVLVSACVYASCQEIGYPININELCKISEASRKELVRTRKFINRYVETKTQGITPEAYLTRYCYELHLTEKEETQALKTLNKICKELINKTSPELAAASIYLTFKDKLSIRDIQRKTGLSKNAIWNSVRLIK